MVYCILFTNNFPLTETIRRKYKHTMYIHDSMPETTFSLSEILFQFCIHYGIFKHTKIPYIIMQRYFIFTLSLLVIISLSLKSIFFQSITISDLSVDRHPISSYTSYISAQQSSLAIIERILL